jgi:flavin-dependent dehydrogenase
MTGVDVDLLVAGGGPVGLATAINARLAGMSVLVVEPRRGSIDKACGEGLMPGTLAELARLGVEPQGRDFRGIRYMARGSSVAHRFRGPAGRGVRRLALHRALDVRAEGLGVQRSVGRVVQVQQHADHVEAAGIRARWLAAADGLHSPVRRSLGLDRPPRQPRRFGQRRHFRIRPWSDLVEVYWTPVGEAYVTPVGDDLVGVAVLAQRGTGYGEVLAADGLLRERLADAVPAGELRGAGPLWQRAARVQQGRVLLVGDAAGYVDAVTGEGIRVGLASARSAVDALVQGRPQDYPSAWSRSTRQFRWMTATLVMATRPAPVRRWLVPAARTVPGVFGAAVERLAV